MRRVVSAFISLIVSLVFAFGPFMTGSSGTRGAAAPEERAPGLEVRFLDVGEGSAAVLISEGHVMVVDGGPSECSDHIYSFLTRRDIRHIDVMVATHPDADHVGGLSGALNAASVGKAYCTVTEHDTKTFRSFVKYLAKQELSVTVPDAGESFTLGCCTVTVLAPVRGESYSDNTSIVLRVVCGNTSFLLMGDSEKEDEEFLMASGAVLRSTVLLAGHHGSASSSYRQFVETVSPRYAVISVGENVYGHPADIVLRNFENAGAAVYRTDLCGDIVCRSDGTEVTFKTEKVMP